MSRGLLVVAFATFFRSAAGHGCENGQRVQCTAVQHLDKLHETHESGFGARGMPMCTSEGRKLYCLVNHNYHQCGASEAPCCMDGSNPYHGGYDSKVDSKPLTCAPVAPSANQLLFDNIDHASVSETQNVFEGSYEPCMRDAYKKQFHHDWAKNKGAASYGFKFEVEKDGCYAVEEYHPGSAYECSRYLPRNARVELDYCRGQSTTWYVNQEKKAAQWNEIGRLPFYKGEAAKITMRNSVHEQCSEPPCFMVMDAFRLTWKSEKCYRPTQHEGSVSLKAHLQNGESSSDVLMKLQKHQDTLQATLALHLGSKYVTISAITVGRRLLADQNQAVYTAKYVAGETISTPSKAPFQDTLQTAFDAVGVGIKFQSATTLLMDTETSGKDDEADGNSLIIVLVVAIAALCVTGGLVFCLCRRLRSQQSTPQAKQADLESIAPAEVTKAKVAEQKPEDNTDDVENASVSTGTPTSDDGQHSQSDDSVTVVADVK